MFALCNIIIATEWNVNESRYSNYRSGICRTNYSHQQIEIENEGEGAFKKSF